MTERFPETFRQWRTPSEDRVEREDEQAERLHESICKDLERTKSFLESINIIPHGGRHGSIDLKVSNNLLIDSGELPESEFDAGDPHEETTLSFAYFTQAYEVPCNDGTSEERITFLYEVGTTTSVPGSFLSLPESLHMEALEALDPNFDADENSDQDIIDALKFYDNPQTAFRIYQDLVVTYEIDPRFSNVQYRYEISYALYQNDERITRLYGESYDSNDADNHWSRHEIVHDPSIDNLSQEVAPAPHITRDHESLDPGEYILTTEAFSDLIADEEEYGTGVISGMSTLQSMKMLHRMVKALPR